MNYFYELLYFLQRNENIPMDVKRRNIILTEASILSGGQRRMSSTKETEPSRRNSVRLYKNPFNGVEVELPTHSTSNNGKQSRNIVGKGFHDSSKKMKSSKTTPLSEMFPNASAEALNLLRSLMQNETKISVKETTMPSN